MQAAELTMDTQEYTMDTYYQAEPVDVDSKAVLDVLNNVYPLQQKQNKDGQAPKRRGPKPDSKPPQTPRQERNRMAQRIHRARKEAHIQLLERQLLTERESVLRVTKEKNAAQIEVKRLVALLLNHGLSLETITSGSSYQASIASPFSSSDAAMSNSQRHNSSATAITSPSNYGSNMHSPRQMQTGYTPLNNNAVDYEQRGIEFVLASMIRSRKLADGCYSLESPCNDHKQYLLVRSHNPEQMPFHHPMERADDAEHDHMSGHALMMSCPPLSHIMNNPGVPYPHKMPDMPRLDLMRLFEASGRLHVPGAEYTPVQAWYYIVTSPRFHLMTGQELDSIQAYLLTTVRCYGFGAVVEEYEINEAIDAALGAPSTDTNMLTATLEQSHLHHGHHHHGHDHSAHQQIAV